MDLLRAALGDADSASSAWARWRTGTDLAAVPSSQLLLLPAVQAAHPEIVDDDAAAVIGPQRRLVWGESEALWATYRRVADITSPLEVLPIVVKGASPHLRTARGPGVRALSDVDIIVEPAHFDQVLDAVTAEGWEIGDHRDPWSHGLTTIAPDGRLVDVHRWVMFPRYASRPETSWFERTRTVDVDGQPVRCLDPADELVLAVTHGISTRGAPAARWPLDVDTLVAVHAAADPRFWSRVVNSTCGCGTELQVARGLELCRTEFDVPIPPWVVQDLVASVSVRDRCRLFAHRFRNSPPGLWTRYRRVARAEGANASIGEFARARLSRLRAQGSAGMAGTIRRTAARLGQRFRG